MRNPFLSILFCFCTSFAQAQENTPTESPTPIQALKAAFVAKDRGDWGGALALAQPAGFVAIDLIEWHRLRASQGEFQDTLNFLRRR
ncbi:MAG: hypothetical protein ACPGRD_07455, partial [Planktomarina sp.]